MSSLYERLHDPDPEDLELESDEFYSIREDESGRMELVPSSIFRKEFPRISHGCDRMDPIMESSRMCFISCDFERKIRVKNF